MKHLSAAAATATALLLVGATPATADPAIGNVQQAMDELVTTPGVVGAISGAYLDGRPVGRGSAGSRLLHGQGGAIPADARFRIGSQTKTMSAVVLLQLVDEGKLRLDSKLADLLPEVAANGLVERADEITVQQLVQHTSGVPDYFSRPGSSAPVFDIFDFTTYHRPLDVVETTRGLPRTGEPGEKFTYSNTGYTLIGMIIERLTGRPLAREFDRRLFGPLGMSRTYQTTRPPEGIEGPHGHGYYPDATGVLRDVDRFNASWANAAGGVVSTTRDISAFQRAFHQGRLLPPALRDIITKGPQPQEAARRGGAECDFKAFGGSAPGYTAMTFTTGDGRQQFAVSVTHGSTDENTIFSAMFTAGQAVMCPAR
ncbi:D-alanyl-D-alanine carboxypeptidase [Crossiella equi]|uniref:D-alanyl-D-alanine carboxypeptidase n=1 Tax=Crossiella equi TaxID=130796 RepID=A0ABS5A7N2_9PSEU|nr:serine hydrolase domain-containing protein [Crossiella equi]MBP2472247.1 D-alanyl-D-alanine carboxypeptidase [Crossiella equi]